jgi:tetraacyldisaccharide 4'-kinase
MERLERIWYGGRRVPIWLSLLEGIYRLLLGTRRSLYTLGVFRSTRLSVPVVVVGNITAGGTGKTPLTIWLARELVARGWHPGVILRGYGGRERGPLLVTPDTAARRAGDEAVLIARATALPVAIAARRVEAGRLLAERHGCDVLIADDGLQHWALARDLEIAVVDGARRFGNGRLVPAGPLRESPERLERVDFVVVNLAAGADPGWRPQGATPCVAMRVSGARVFSLQRPGEAQPLSAFAGRRVHALAAIGNPERYFAMLEANGLELVRHAFPDHGRLTRADLYFGDDLPVLVTEKDAVKLKDVQGVDAWVVPVSAELPEGFADGIHAALHARRAERVPG